MLMTAVEENPVLSGKIYLMYLNVVEVVLVILINVLRKEEEDF